MGFLVTLFCGSLILKIRKLFLHLFREMTFAIDQEVCFSFQSAVYFEILKIRTLFVHL